MLTKLQEKWNFHYETPHGHVLYPFRHLITYSYLLDTDATGKRTHQLDLSELQHRVLASNEIFALWLAELEQDDIFVDTNRGVITDKVFVEAKRLIDERYAPHIELFGGYTGHQILDLVHSSVKKDSHLLADIIESIVKDALGLITIRLTKTLIQIDCPKFLWTMWIEVFSSRRQIQTIQPIIHSMKVMKQFTREKPDRTTYYLVCGPAFGSRFSDDAKGELTLLWSLSVINFLRELRGLKTEFPTDKLQICLPQFFQGQEGKIAHSTTEGFSKMKKCLEGK